MKQIKVRTAYREYDNTYYTTTFDITDKMPAVGEEYNNEVITKVIDVRLDTEERNEEAFNYEYFHIETKDEDDNEWDYNLAVPVEVIHPELKMYRELEDEFGTVDIEGISYILLYDAKLYDDDCRALAIAPWNDAVDENGEIPCYEVIWDVTNPEAEDLEDCCKWDAPDDVKEWGYFEIATGMYR